MIFLVYLASPEGFFFCTNVFPRFIAVCLLIYLFSNIRKYSLLNFVEYLIHNFKVQARIHYLFNMFITFHLVSCFIMSPS